LAETAARGGRRIRAAFRYETAHRDTADRLNANTVAMMTGAFGSTYEQIGADLASVLDDGDNLRLLPVVGRSPEPNTAKAEAYFDLALTVARQQQAKSWELRAARSMARLWRDQGKRDAARDLLAPVYGWFTEGFDTLDLKEAKALLDKLAA
jgi:hypothetical protein